MKFAPKSEREIASANIWEKGTYGFEILEAEETTSKKTGSDMIKLKVKVFRDNGSSQNIFDYLLGDNMEYKLRHCAEACGLLTEYESGELEAYTLVGKTGHAKVGISIDKTGQYHDKNSIVDYLTDKPATTVKEAVKGDDVPW